MRVRHPLRLALFAALASIGALAVGIGCTVLPRSGAEFMAGLGALVASPVFAVLTVLWLRQHAARRTGALGLAPLAVGVLALPGLVIAAWAVLSWTVGLATLLVG